VRRRLAAALVVALQLLPLSIAGMAAAAGAGYTMSSVAVYAVDPAAGEIVVTVQAVFTNTTPNPPGQLSGFDRIELAIQGSATQPAASDGKGALSVELLNRDGVEVASVRPRTTVRFNHSASFTLSYHLLDGATSEVHVRPEVIRFSAWGFGTSSEVTVDLPADYQARADGDPMVINTAGHTLRMTSGQIPDPTTWLALVTATRPTSYAVPLTASVALASGTVDLQVRAWTTDPAWADRVLTTLSVGLLRLEEAIGLPYPRVGPLVVSEAVGGEGSPDLRPLSAAEMQVAFDADAFTLLHQAAHIWISDQLAADRWLREGMASHVAAIVAAGIGTALPYDPAARASALAADAFPLAAWGSEATPSMQDGYGYAASWALVDRIAATAGEATLGRTLRRVVAGVGAYDPADADQLSLSAGRFAPVDTRRFIDQMAAASGVDASHLVGQAVLGPDAGAELRDRQLARDDYQRLLQLAGDWGAPDPIRTAMAAWRFDEARPAMAVALTWLLQRDALIAKVARAGLTTPAQLRAHFAAVGGGADAETELTAEVAVVDAYLEVQARAAAPRGPLETIGLFAADDPRGLLAAAGGDFARGDLSGAARTLDAAEVQLNRAPTNGVVRIASAIVLVTVIVLLLNLTIRRRGGSHYTGPR
jgi:hypothetical protein